MAWVPRRLMLLLAGSALLLAPLLAVQLSAGAGRAHACECYPETGTELLDKADAVLSGRVISVAEYWEPVVIEVDRVWKGSAPSTTRVYADDGTSCSYGGFVEGEAYLVYADVSPGDGTLSTWACSGTAQLASLDDASQALQRGREAAPEPTQADPASGAEEETPGPAPTSSDAQQAPAPPSTGSAPLVEGGERIAGPGTSDAATPRAASADAPTWAIPFLAGLVAASVLVRLAVRPRLRAG